MRDWTINCAALGSGSQPEGLLGLLGWLVWRLVFYVMGTRNGHRTFHPSDGQAGLTRLAWQCKAGAAQLSLAAAWSSQVLQSAPTSSNENAGGLASEKCVKWGIPASIHFLHSKA